MAASQHVPGLLQVVRLPHPEQKNIMNLGSKGSAENHVLFLLEGRELFKNCSLWVCIHISIKKII